MKIRTRIFLCFVLILAAGFYYLVNWVTNDLRPRYLESMEESLVDIATVLSSLLSQEMDGGNLDTRRLRDAFQDVRARTFTAKIYDLTKTHVDIRVYVTDERGTVLFDSDDGRDEGEDYSRWNDVHLTLRGEYGARSTRTDPADPRTSILHVASPVVVGGNTVGVLTIGKPAGSSNLFIDSAKRKIFTAALLAGVAVVFLAILTSTWITRPIQQLIRYVQSVRDGERVPLPDLGRSEIGIMGTALDEMRRSLEGKEYIEQYVQTLTHELKGPLTAIRGAAELLGEDVPVEQRKRFLKNIRQEAERIQRVVDRLLLLASLESRGALTDVEQVDLAEVVRETLDSMAPILEGKNLTLDCSLHDPLAVRGERFLLRQAIINLLQNAAAFCPDGGSIRVEANCADDWAEVVVVDNGSGLPPYAAARVFERFYSLPRPDTGEKSSGLGLTFVKEVAELHGGTITLANRLPVGVQATLRVPFGG